MGFGTVIIVLLGILTFVYMLACAYVWMTVGRAYGQGVFLHGKAVPYVALLELTTVRAFPLILATDNSFTKGWIAAPYTSNGQMSSSKHLYDLPDWAWYTQGFGH